MSLGSFILSVFSSQNIFTNVNNVTIECGIKTMGWMNLQYLINISLYLKNDKVGHFAMRCQGEILYNCQVVTQCNNSSILLYDTIREICYSYSYYVVTVSFLL